MWIWITVARTYYSMILQVIAVSGILKMLGLSWWGIALLLLCMIPVIILLVYLHMTYIYPKFLSENWKKNPEVRKLMGKL